MKTNTKIVHSLRVFFIVLCWFFSPVLYGQVLSGQIVGKETIGSWTSFGLFNKQDVRYRATAIGSDPTVFVLIDVFGSNCKSDISFGFPYNPPLDHDIQERILPLNVRVDASELYFMNSTYSGVMGDTAGFITLAATPKYSDLLLNMRLGNVLRVKFQEANGSPISTMSFPLRGFSKSLNRIQAACVAAKAPPTSNPPPVTFPQPTPHKKLKDVLRTYS